MAIDFSKLTSRKLSESKRPPALPIANYPVIITKYEFVEKNRREVLTGAVRYTLKITGEPEDGSLTPGELDGIDLSSRSIRADFYLGNDIDYILKDFLVSMGVDEDVDFQEGCPKVIGLPAIADVQQYLNQRTNETENQVNALRPAD